MKHSYGRTRNSLWRVINTRAFARYTITRHYDGRSIWIPFGSPVWPAYDERYELCTVIRDFCRWVLSLSKDELSPFIQRLRHPPDSFANKEEKVAYAEFPWGKFVGLCITRVTLCGTIDPIQRRSHEIMLNINKKAWTPIGKSNGDQINWHWRIVHDAAIRHIRVHYCVVKRTCYSNNFSFLDVPNILHIQHANVIPDGTQYSFNEFTGVIDAK